MYAENFLSIPPFFISMLAPEGVRIGNFYLGKYANGGEAITVLGIGSQSASLSFGGIVELPASIPFPHSTETYINLLKEQKQFWYQLTRPLKIFSVHLSLISSRTKKLKDSSLIERLTI